MSFMICSYADESGDKQVYSVCGLISKLEEFVELGRVWRQALTEEGLTEFHASKLENNLKPFDDLKRFHKDYRDHLQRKFIGLITSRPIWGFNAFVEHAALSAHETSLKRFMSHTEPYTFSFRMFVEILAVEVDEYKLKNEPIAFIFDQQKEFEGKAKEMYDYLATDGQWPLSYRLGSISFESRLNFVELQAADVWAYESRKHVTDYHFKKHEERWQMTMFKDCGRFNITGYPDAEMRQMIARMERGDVVRPESTTQRKARRKAEG